MFGFIFQRICIVDLFFLFLRPFYGTASWTFSNIGPVPNFFDGEWLEKCEFFLFFFLSIPPNFFFFFFFFFFFTHPKNLPGASHDEKTFGFGQNAALFCPNTLLHPEYNAGTYSGMLYGLTQTEFEIELLVNPDVSFFLSFFPFFPFLCLIPFGQSYPLDPPSDKASCSDVPADVVAFAERHNPAHCIEDSGSQTFTFEDTNEEFLFLLFSLLSSFFSSLLSFVFLFISLTVPFFF